MSIWGIKKVDFYKRDSPLDRGNIKDISQIERNLSPTIDLNYRRFLPEERGAKILDVGCGWGYFLYYLKKNGYFNIEGIDLKVHAKRFEFIKNNITTNVKGIDSIDEYLNSRINEYDLIILQQVIYYLKREDLLTTIQCVKNALKKDGILILETFNGSLLTSTFVQNIDYHRHIIFTEYSLASLILDAGFELKDLFGMVLPRKAKLKSFIWASIEKIWILLLKLIYILERGINPYRIPHIFSKHIIAVAQKKKE